MQTRRTLLKSAALALPVLAVAPSAFAAKRIASGTFTGKSRHVTTGTASIIEDGGNHFVQLEADFTFDGAPDPKVALGNNGYDPATLLAPLQKNAGAQAYAIPASIDVAAYNEVWIWCERFNVPLGLATLS
ncbi:MAG: DM13 domain-containing protein [Pseudomonadota bacterium]